MPPNRAVHTWTLCGGIYISQRAFTAFLLWIGWNFPGFKSPKQALRTPHCLKLWGPRSKRFLICLRSREQQFNIVQCRSTLFNIVLCFDFALQSYKIILDWARYYCKNTHFLFIYLCMCIICSTPEGTSRIECGPLLESTFVLCSPYYITLTTFTKTAYRLFIRI